VERKSLIDETKTYEWSVLVEKGMTYGLMGIAFGLFFVPLNHIVEYTFFGLLCFGIGWQWNNGTLQWIRTSFDWPIFFYVVWVLLCIPFAVDPAYSFDEWRKVLSHILLFYFVIQTVKMEQQVCRIIWASAGGIAILSLMESVYFLWQGSSPWTMASRAGDLTGSSQWLSVYIVMGLPIVWSGLEIVRTRTPWIWYCFGVSFLISIVGLFLSHTRGAWVAVGIQVLIYVFVKLKRGAWVIFGSSALLVTLLFLVLLIPGRHHDFLKMSQFSNPWTMQLRFNTWSLAFQDIKDNSLTGLGLGKHSFGKYHPEITGVKTGYHDHIHNSFLSKAVQIGIPGFLLFAWIFIGLIIRSYSLFERFPHEDSGKLALAISLVIIGVIVRNLFDDMFYGTVAYLFWLYAGLLICLDNLLKDIAVKTAKP